MSGKLILCWLGFHSLPATSADLIIAKHYCPCGKVIAFDAEGKRTEVDNKLGKIK